ncbi:hypothetical protein FA13DRAFT_1332910 [Coprinellus micaceus]|uniref:Uncharacterized protein n=1 Tax=Coprinellus micaceus TaxID=71717 RepID=A0A4Y7TN10_COPMI|nr:hypothetical protein FA13DRAFT_1332910 [Coprinellus micaceus]
MLPSRQRLNSRTSTMASLCCWHFKVQDNNKRVTHLRLKSLQFPDRSLRNLPKAIPTTSQAQASSSKGKHKASLDPNETATKRMRTRSSTSTAPSSTAKDDDDEGGEGSGDSKDLEGHDGELCIFLKSALSAYSQTPLYITTPI